MVPSHTPSIRQYSLTGPSAPSTISQALALLRPYLTLSIPLYRRLQSGHFTDSAAFYTNVDLTTTPTTTKHSHNDDSDDHPKPFLAAYTDRSLRPETEVLLFGSWEAQNKSDYAHKDGIAEALLRDLLLQLKALPLPPSIHTTTRAPEVSSDSTQKDSIGFSRSDYASHFSNPQIMLWGAVHERTLPLLQNLGVLPESYKVGSAPNDTFIFELSSLPPAQNLPSGLRWGKVRPKDFGLIKSLTQIPRQERTMALLSSLAIYPCRDDGDEGAAPIAWAFIGLDGSLTTLHVQPEWRGKGLAKQITCKLFREKMEKFWEPGADKLAHGYVVGGNTASEGMCRKLGGKCDWQVFWLRVNLSGIE